ncbi:hypothetical protein VC273_22230 [Xanthomonas nasturtii]|uniref:hypothetical protein n=1 Tax=Xanthomonas TaxID=338 RepID=UPI002B235DCF|nr:hypothetical protein [Xanthomonas nasturtii]MEA9558505.1 hypothetical protein [Xanthomonas nasturtii]
MQVSVRVAVVARQRQSDWHSAQSNAQVHWMAMAASYPHPALRATFSRWEKGGDMHADRAAMASTKHQAPSTKHQAPSTKQQATSNKQQATSNKQQATSNKQCAAGSAS